MKKLLILLPALVLLQSCSGLTDAEETSIAGELKSYTYEKCIVEDDGKTCEKKLVPTFELEKVTTEGEGELAGFTEKRRKALGEIVYKSNQDGLISCNGQYFTSKKALLSYLSNTVYRRTHLKRCIKNCGIFPSGKPKYKMVRKKNSAQIEKEIKNEYGNEKSFNNGDIIQSEKYVLKYRITTGNGKKAMMSELEATKI
jgi:hypothetical protein